MERTNQQATAGRSGRGVRDRVADERRCDGAAPRRSQPGLRPRGRGERAAAEVQVKTSTQSLLTPDGHRRSAVALATKGGNQSWNGVSRTLDPSRLDYLFALTGDGRRWFIPSTDLRLETRFRSAGRSTPSTRSSRAAQSISSSTTRRPLLESELLAGEYPSGQRMATVNRPAQPSQVRILPPPFRPRSGLQPSVYDRRLGRGGLAIVERKATSDASAAACIEAGLQDGDRSVCAARGTVASYSSASSLLQRGRPLRA